jgi:hypothetical protein
MESGCEEEIGNDIGTQRLRDKIVQLKSEITDGKVCPFRYVNQHAVNFLTLQIKLQALEAQRAADLEKIKTLEATLDTYSQNSALTVTQQGLQVCYHNVVALRTV